MNIREMKNRSKRSRELRRRAEKLTLSGAFQNYIKVERAFHEYTEAVLDADEGGDFEKVSNLSRSAPNVFRMLDNATYILEPQLKKLLRRLANNQKSKEILEDIFDKG